jgi:hypothetical protein
MTWEPLMIKCTILSCGCLASSFPHCACMRELMWEYQLKYMTSSILGVACFSWSTLLIALTKNLKCSSDHHFHVSLLSPKLGLPTKGGKPLPKGEVTSLQRTILDTNLKWHCLIDPSDGFNLMSNLESFFKSFSFYLFKSFCFYQIIFNHY